MYNVYIVRYMNWILNAQHTNPEYNISNTKFLIAITHLPFILKICDLFLKKLTNFDHLNN